MAIYRRGAPAQIELFVPAAGDARDSWARARLRLAAPPSVAKPVDPSAVSEGDKAVSAQRGPALAALATLVLGVAVAVALFGTEAGPSFTPADGIAAFALVYVVAQAAERLVEVLGPVLGRVPSLEKREKEARRDRAVVEAGSPAQSPEDADATAKAAANAQRDVDQARANRSVVTFALTAALGVVACAYFEADFLTTVGVRSDSTIATEVVLMTVTALVIGGGSKALHDTVTTISKSSEKKSTPPETGGS